MKNLPKFPITQKTFIEEERDVLIQLSMLIDLQAFKSTEVELRDKFKRNHIKNDNEC